MKRLWICLVALLTMAAHGESKLKLSDVARFDASAIGYAAAKSPNYEAFLAELSRGDAAIPEFEALLKDGTAAAKLYSAIGLYHFDKARGVAALETLRGDSTPVTGMAGCMMEQATVGSMAEELLKDDGIATRAYLPRELR